MIASLMGREMLSSREHSIKRSSERGIERALRPKGC